MPLRSNSVNYAERTVDLLLLKTVLRAPVTNKRVDLDVEHDPMIVTGVEKLLQRYVLIFLSELGTCHVDEGRGTRIMADVSNGRIYDEATLTTSAAEANMLTRDQIAADDSDSESPSDERLSNSEVTSVSLDKQTATARISVRITTEAGDSLDYIIPVGIGVRS
jgi:hypothetical protein